jgi:hypothetical protein
VKKGDDDDHRTQKPTEDKIYQLNSACFLLICSKCCSNATTEFVLVFDEYFFARFLGGNGGSF